MRTMTNLLALPSPSRASLSDSPEEILRFAMDAFGRGDVALATLVDIRGGAARSLGSQLAVAADGRFCGFVSGGCVEAAVALEALQAIAEGRDRQVKFGEGSPFFDIVLPCGGGITVAIHLLREVAPIRHVLHMLGRRQAVSLIYSPGSSTLHTGDAKQRSGWMDKIFFAVFRPKTRILLSGQLAETEAVSRLAAASGYDVVGVENSGVSGAELIDPYTAVALLHHDLETESDILSKILASPAFYIGALGSSRTHRRRVERLTVLGIEPTLIDKIKAPIGMFGPTRDTTALALSVLADIAAARLQTFG